MFRRAEPSSRVSATCAAALSVGDPSREGCCQGSDPTTRWRASIFEPRMLLARCTTAVLTVRLRPAAAQSRVNSDEPMCLALLAKLTWRWLSMARGALVPALRASSTRGACPGAGCMRGLGKPKGESSVRACRLAHAACMHAGSLHWSTTRFTRSRQRCAVADRPQRRPPGLCNTDAADKLQQQPSVCDARSSSGAPAHNIVHTRSAAVMRA